jgi:hypothetical protein
MDDTVGPMLGQLLNVMANLSVPLNQRGTAWESGQDLSTMSHDELLNESTFLRYWQGLRQIAAICDPKLNLRATDNPLFVHRLDMILDELSTRHAKRAA